MKIKTKSRKVSKAWLSEHVSDPYVKLAQHEGYRARAAYKLKEIDEQLGLVRPGQTIVDLGAAPGAWSQYLRARLGHHGRPSGTPDATEPGGGPAACQAVAPGRLQGRIIALDLLPMDPIEGVTVLQGDFTEDAVFEQLRAALGGERVDLVVSDMAPNLSGIASSDAAKITTVVEAALDFALTHLRPEGALVVKLFHGSGYSQLVERFKRHFLRVKPIKPKASRARSSETFLVGLGLKHP